MLGIMLNSIDLAKYLSELPLNLFGVKKSVTFDPQCVAGVIVSNCSSLSEI